MNPTEAPMKQIAVRISGQTLDRLNKIRPSLAIAGVAVTLTDAIRCAIFRGLLELEREHRKSMVDWPVEEAAE